MYVCCRSVGQDSLNAAQCGINGSRDLTLDQQFLTWSTGVQVIAEHEKFGTWVCSGTSQGMRCPKAYISAFRGSQKLGTR